MGEPNGAAGKAAVVDACVYHEWLAHQWASAEPLRPYLAGGWRDLLLEPGVITGVPPQYPDIFDDAEPIMSLDALEERVLGPRNLDRVVLSYDAGLRATTNPNYFVAHALASAMNRWTEDEWLGRDERVYGLVVAPLHQPEEAAAEIRRSGANPRMVGVLLGAAVHGAPLGNPAYHPVYEAAVEMGLPIVLQAGIDHTNNSLHPPAAAGAPATTVEAQALAWHAQSAHLASLIMHGVFDLFPDLRVLLTGAGVLWLPSVMWRLDHRLSVTRSDTTWISRLPTDYLPHFALATQRLECAADRERTAQALSVVPEIESRLLYASGTPTRDALEAQATADRLPEGWTDKVLGQNALDFFRWPSEVPAPARATSKEV